MAQNPPTPDVPENPDRSAAPGTHAVGAAPNTPAAGGTSGTPAIPVRALDRLVSRLEGEVFVPGDPGYAAELAGFNLSGRHRPALVAAVRGADDVCETVRFAAENDLPVGVHATGHGIAGGARGGVLISTRRMNHVSVDPVARTARVEAGARWHQVVAGAGPHGLAPLNGSSSLVGVVGYTLGGGLGPLGRQYGWAADHVTTIDVVTPDGVLRTASPEEHANLFWALRGGKGDFGVVTALEFRLMPVARLFGGGLYFPGEQTADVLRTWQRWTAGVPETMTSSVALLRLPDHDEVPAFLRAGLAAHVRVAFTGDRAEGERLIRPLRELGGALADSVDEMPYTEVDRIHQDPTDPMPYHERNIVLRDLDADAIERLLRLAGPGSDCTDLMVELRHLGGALARPAEEPNAVGARDGAYTLSTLSPTAAPDPVLAGMSPWGTGRRYLNFVGGPEPAEPAGLTGTGATGTAGASGTTVAHAAADCFDPATYARLRRVKAAYDPKNLFRLGHTIGPGA